MTYKGRKQVTIIIIITLSQGKDHDARIYYPEKLTFKCVTSLSQGCRPWSLLRKSVEWASDNHSEEGDKGPSKHSTEQT